VEAEARNIIVSGVNPALGRGATDFGRGFYVTSVRHQAEQWANQKARRHSQKAAVLAFRLDRDLIGKLGDHLTFVIADTDFHAFVAFNRQGGIAHARSDKKCYDVIYGPVAAYPQALTYAGCDQICFTANGNAIGIQALSKPTNADLTVGNPYLP